MISQSRPWTAALPYGQVTDTFPTCTFGSWRLSSSIQIQKQEKDECQIERPKFKQIKARLNSNCWSRTPRRLLRIFVYSPKKAITMALFFIV